MTVFSIEENNHALNRGQSKTREFFGKFVFSFGDDSTLQAPVLARMVDNEAVVRLQNVPQAHEWALQGVAAALDRADHRMLVRHALAWTQALQGHPVDVPTDPPDTGGVVHTWTPDRIAGQRLVWRGEVDQARTVLTRLLRTADEQGAPWAYAIQRLHLCELELRTGRWAAAGELLDEWADSLDSRLLHWPMYERCRALAAAGTGLGRRGPSLGGRGHQSRGRDGSPVGPVRGTAGPRLGGLAAARPRGGRAGTCSRYGSTAERARHPRPRRLSRWHLTWSRRWWRPGTCDSAAEVTERLRVLGVERGPSLGAGDRAAGARRRCTSPAARADDARER